jgi:hydrogenase maturation protein HypF
VALISPLGDIVVESNVALTAAQAHLLAGHILAIKGIGGFHLACDASSEEAVSRLRFFKSRPHRPMAVMCPDLERVREICWVSPEEARELTAPERPILLLKRRRIPEHLTSPIAADIAFGLEDIGVMLPYTPLHHLLLGDEGPSCLVMTSGNRRDEPIVVDNEEATASLGMVCDALLVHDRPIWNRCDDSVGFVDGKRLVVTRRSRGYAPLPVHVSQELRPTLALGAVLSDTFALGFGRRVFLSQHIGDVDNSKTLSFLRESIEKLSSWLDINPRVVAHDLHPDLLTSRLALELAEGRERVPVQHHHAHFAAALVAAGVAVEAQGLVLDGTGWGPDGSIWGGELLVGSAARLRRAGHLRPLPLPGGDAAIRRPVRLAAAYVHSMVPSAEDAPLALWSRISAEEARIVRRMAESGFNTPSTTSAGRLFDAVSALLGVRDAVTYEGQAAIELEHLARRGKTDEAPLLKIDVVEQNARLILDPEPAFATLTQAMLDGIEPANLAMGFHSALAESLAAACARVRDGGGPSLVALCGGVFQNRILTRLTGSALKSVGLEPLLPGLVPVNDGGLALGQAVVANARQAGESVLLEE